MRQTGLGHGRGWLRADAAASLLRVDRQIGHPLQITDAGRTNADQWAMWRKYGSPRAAYPGTSTHETGIAIDTDERLVRVLADHGWSRPFRSEPWHFKYTIADDNHLPTTTTGDEEMLQNIKGKAGKRSGGTWLLKDGQATFLGHDPKNTAPYIEDEGVIRNLAKHYEGLPA